MRSSFFNTKSIIIFALIFADVLGNATQTSELFLYWVEILNRPPDNIYDPGYEIEVECRIRNAGDAISDSYIVDFYADSYHLGSESRSPLGVEEYDIFSTTVSLPEDLPEGIYRFCAQVTCLNYVNLYDNKECETYTIKRIDKHPDLRIVNINTNHNIFRPGDSIILSTEIENNGNKDAESYSIEFFAGDFSIGYGSGCCLEPSEIDSIETTCTFPDNIPEDYYNIWARIECSEETSSDDNETSCSTEVWVGPYPDLGIQAVDATDGIYMPGDEIVIYSLIKNVGDKISSSYTIDYYISKDITITNNDSHIGYINRIALLPNQQHSYDTTCRLPVDLLIGNFFVGAIVTCSEDYDSTNNTGYDNSTLEGIHPAGYVCGQIEYKYSIYRKPLRYALLEVYGDNNNATGDRMIGQTYTDNEGRYGIVLQNNTQNTHDIYIRVYTKGFSGAYPGTTSEICDVRDDVFDESYFLESSLYPHPRDSSVVINMTALGEVGAFLVYDSIVEGFHKAKTFFDIELEETAAYWPFSEDISCFVPNVGIFIAEGDQRDRDVIMHEYGHYIAEEYNFTQGEVGDDGRHFWDRDLRYEPVSRTDEQARNLAFREAWATLFSIATQHGDTGYTYSGDNKYQDYDSGSDYTFEVDLENGTRDHDSPGQYYENMNTCALWDIFDDESCEVDNFDSLSDTSLSKIWSIMKEYKPDDIIDFWNSWFRRYDFEGDIRCIFLDHEMNFVEQP